LGHHEGAATGDHPHWVQEQLNKWVEHHTLTKNLKALGLWVLLLIKCLTSTYLSNVGLTHSHLPQRYYYLRWSKELIVEGHSSFLSTVIALS
jgi:hypothetical protein